MSEQHVPDPALEHAYNPRVAATGYEAKIEARAAESARVRETFAHHADLRYGPGPKETLDIFPARAGRPHGEGRTPVQLFIHGGYWRANDKSDYSFVAPPFVERGATVVVINYDLCPEVSLEEIVEQACRSIAWTWRNIEDYGGDPGRLYISGNSAGGHLVAMALARDWEAEGLPGDIVRGASAITGVHDCEPVLRISVNEDVRLTPEMARRLSPVHNLPRRPVPLIVSVGGAEPAEWIAMSREYARRCEEAGIPVDYLELPGMDHFDISGALGDPASPLTMAMLRQMGLA